MLIPALLVAFLVQTPPPADIDPLTAAGIYVQDVLKTLPAWEDDKLAQYEQFELAAVRRDLQVIKADIVEDDVLHDVDRLRDDFSSLEVLDKLLHGRNAI